MTRARIVVMTTGGTIASRRDPSGRNRSGALQGEELMHHVTLPPEAEVDLEVRSVLQKPSNAITLDDLLYLRQECLVLAESSEVKGIVITHGTDTLEETAYFLDIMLPTSLTLVLTGSQRAPHEPGTDAFRNLADAVLVAVSDQARGLGTLVVFNQSIFSARQVRKTSSFQVNGFASPETGPIGYIDGTRVSVAMRPARPEGLNIPIDATLPRVDILPAYLDASPDLLESAVEAGAAGLVIDGLGRGHVPPSWLNIIPSITQRGIPVAIVSSCPTGPVHPSYEFTGSLASLEAIGVIAVQDLSARKARLLLSALLASSRQSEIAERLRTLTA
ncbi:asparaginase [Halomonas sp. MCCC 1A17488]|nr:asparaginase [Halomonas sp. SS10-MC5]MCE8016233.1 asparaginase [Halomonas sp. MCCC 1A17488]MCG3239566.1 asparaginase [Halomonas sp. MCCC 1A17488]QPP51525.1 asparaginase [Halomonas sp. SS10-MC5]